MKPSPLTVRNAQIATSTVEVRTLTVSGKQVTLAVFRQLIEESWWSEAEGDHPIWGRVNYCPDKTCQKCRVCTALRASCPARHTHIIWQKGDELRRDTVRGPCDAGDRPDDAEWNREWYWDVMLHVPQIFIAV